jgi:C1A family cysteine protease
MTIMLKSGIAAIENPRVLPCVTRNGTSGRFRPFLRVMINHVFTAMATVASYVSPKTNSFCQRVPIRNQQDIGACTAFATTGAITVKKCEQGTPYVEGQEGSTKHCYLLCRDEQGQADEDSGSDTQHCLYTYQTTGVCREAVFPWTDTIVDVTGKAERPSIDALTDAANFRIPGIDWDMCSSLDEVEQEVRAANPVIFGTEVDSTIQSYQQGQILGAPDENNIIGGHEMCIVGVIYKWSDLPTDVFGTSPTRPRGYSDGTRIWLIRNSWGVGYGYNGYLLVNDAFLANPSVAGSLAAVKAA